MHARTSLACLLLAAAGATLAAQTPENRPTLVPSDVPPHLQPYPFGPAPSGLQPRWLPAQVTLLEAALMTPGEILIVRSGDPERIESLESARAITLRPVEVRVRRTGARFFGIAFEFPDFATGYLDRDEITQLIKELGQLPRVDTTSAATELTKADVRFRTRGGLEFTLGARFEDRPVLQLQFQPARGTAETLRFDTSRGDRFASLLEKLEGVLRRSGG